MYVVHLKMSWYVKLYQAQSDAEQINIIFLIYFSCDHVAKLS